MAKLNELNGWDLMAALAEMAEPVGNLAGDDAVWKCFEECTKRGVSVRQKDGLRFILRTYSKLFPLLFGKAHRRDTMRIMSVIEGKPIDELMQMNGKQLMDDVKVAIEENLKPFFTKSVPLAKSE